MPMQEFESVDEYLDSLEFFQSEVRLLRQIVLSTKLQECIKWSMPCYTHNGKNVVGIGAFKSYFGLWFHEGASIDDKHGVLINAQEGKTRALRQWRMTIADELRPRIIKSYITAARRVAESGKSTRPNRNKPIVIPAELQVALNADEALSTKFAALRPASRREYAEYIAEAKKAETKLRRIEKIKPMILESIGLHDQYRST